MRPVTVHTSISAPREEIFDYVADLAGRVAYCDHYMTDFRLTRPRSAGKGAGARFMLRPPAGSEWAEIAIVEADRPGRIQEEGRVGRLGRSRAGAVYELLAAEHGTTRVELTIWTEPSTRLDRVKEAIGGRRWLTRQSKVALERLRQIFEERPEGELARVGIAGYESLTASRFGA